MPIYGIWQNLVESECLQRSSQTVSVIDGKAYIFGGELRPREPVDDNMHQFELDSTPKVTIQALSTGDRPSPRVGAASATLHGKFYLFSGRGGAEVAPIEENGGLWRFDSSISAWQLLAPADPGRPYPSARSYHCMASDVAANKLYVHAGCTESGRLSDLWAFDIISLTWTQREYAPEPSRGGTSIVISNQKLYRMNGFDGEKEQGGSVDVYCPIEDRWASIYYKPDAQEGPTPRSVSSLVAVQIGAKEYLVTLFGECDPSSAGHQGAGKMLSDVWAFDVADKKWNEVKTAPDNLPQARGWFGAHLVDTDKVLVHGGLNEANERLGDAWILSFHK